MSRELEAPVSCGQASSGDDRGMCKGPVGGVSSNVIYRGVMENVE